MDVVGFMTQIDLRAKAYLARSKDKGITYIHCGRSRREPKE